LKLEDKDKLHRGEFECRQLIAFPKISSSLFKDFPKISLSYKTKFQGKSYLILVNQKSLRPESIVQLFSVALDRIEFHIDIDLGF
jgi:hypothetical protein